MLGVDLIRTWAFAAIIIYHGTWFFWPTQVGPPRPFPTPLWRVASIFAMRAVEVRCPTVEEWAADPYAADAWSYAHLGAGYAVLRPDLCAGALAPEERRIASWERAAGVLALVHEAYHLRRWSRRRDK